MLVPEPLLVIPPGFLIKVQFPLEGNPFKTTLPVATEQLVWVIVPMEGVEGTGFTVSVKLAEADSQGEPSGLSVVTVMITSPPASLGSGV